MAKTRFGLEDCIITDVFSADEVLREHWQVIPAALLARVAGNWVSY